MEIFDVFRLNGIENYPAAGEKILENVILKGAGGSIQLHISADL